MNTRPFELMSVREWADRFIRNESLRDFFLSLCRVVTYSTDERQCASVALDQLKRAMLGVVYVHEGWQKIVDSLHSTAVAAGVKDKVTFIHGDLFEADVSGATVVAVFLLPSMNMRLIPKFRQQLRPGARIVAHHFMMGDTWPPDVEQDVSGLMIYLWNIR